MTRSTARRITALLTTLTFKMPAADAVLILICMYVGAIYGGSWSAILLNIPGTPANAATSASPVQSITCPARIACRPDLF